MLTVLLLLWGAVCVANTSDGVPMGCGGFIKADFPVDFTKIKVCITNCVLPQTIGSVTHMLYITVHMHTTTILYHTRSVY